MPRDQRFRPSTIGLAFALGVVASPAAAGDCLLANPSFELTPGSGGAQFGEWNQFGIVGNSAPLATHGAHAARLIGPDAGGWDLSAVWQRLETEPGERWTASVVVTHSTLQPLTGKSRAILNIEWRDAVGRLLSYESHTAADASTLPGTPTTFAVESGPAPAGTAATHFLLGVLQSPTAPPPEVTFDEAEFDRVGPPSLDDIQWNDFPGGRTHDFAGRAWRIKGPGFYGPGPNQFCDTAACTWVDGEGELHLTVSERDGTWYSSEVVLEEALGYGDYVITTRGRLDAWHPNVVFGAFLWQYAACFDPSEEWWGPYNEIDIEFGRWGDPTNDIGQFVAQPYDFPGNLETFDATFADDELTSHAFRWLPDRVEFRSWRGGADDERVETGIHAWTYAGPHLPRLEQPRLHLNLWHFGAPPGSNQEVVISGFRFVPDGGVVEAEPPLAIAGVMQRDIRPNPFRDHTVVSFSTRTEARTRIDLFDVAGRRVRALLDRRLNTGAHEIAWDGRDDGAVRVAPGVYFARLSANGRSVYARVVVVR